jgi:hypothetical protein
MKRSLLLLLAVSFCLSIFSIAVEPALAQEIVFFDGLQVPGGQFSTLGVWFGEWWWWMDGLAYQKGAGYTPGTDAILWEQCNGESNFIWGFATPQDMSARWQSDSLKFKVKAPADNDTLIVEFASGNGKVHYYISAANFTFDPDDWKLAAIPLKDFVQYTEQPFDPAAVTQFSIYTLKGVGGNKLLMTDIWVGNPKLRLPVVFFTGQLVPDGLFGTTGWWSAWEWVDGLATMISTEAGPEAGAHSIAWPERDGWSGITWLFSSPRDFRDLLPHDTLRFKIMGPARANGFTIEINSGKQWAVQYYVDKSEAMFDSTWHQLNIPLANFAVPPGKSPLDSQFVAEVGFFTDSGTDGITLYLSQIWIGNPSIELPDTEAPAAPENVSAALDKSGPYYFNLVTWSDAGGESGESYDLYASPNPINDLGAADVQLLASGLGEDAGAAGVKHYIFAPLEDSPNTWYYAVTCKDKAGNLGPAGFSPAITTDAMGIATISLQAPVFVADGDLDEWAHIKPITLNVNTSLSNGITDDADMTADIYLAVDDSYLYFAADVKDDKFMIDISTGNWYGQWDKQDAITLYIGLYDLMGRKHTNATTSTLRASEPDYVLSFMQDKLWVRTMDSDWDFIEFLQSYTPAYWFDTVAGENWTVEAKIPLDQLVREKGGITDKRFHPVQGMKIPLDITIYDKDKADEAEGVLVFSPYNVGGWDASWFSPNFWANTWIGTGSVGVADERPMEMQYALMQNYPNPFNPSTQITYSLAHASSVSLKIYDRLGREAATLVQGFQTAGMHRIDFSAAAHTLTSGIYFYRLEAGSYIEQKKMVLVK